MFGILKPAPYRPRIKDPAVVKRRFRYWQIRTMYSMYIGYVLFYFTRKNLLAALPGMKEGLGYTMTDLGWILTLSSLAYGVSKFTSGLLSDRSNPRYFMAIGLFVVGILNLFFGMSSHLLWLGIIWALNGWFQGWGWPPSSRLLMHWYGQKQRARWWSIWNTSHNLGGAIIPIVAVFFITLLGGWQYALYIPGVIAILGSLFLVNRLRDTPQSLGLPPIEEFCGEREAKGEEDFQERELTTREILVKHVLFNRYIWLLSLAYFFVYLVRQSINDWSLIYLVDGQGCNPAKASFCVGIFEIGGLFGSLAAGWLSDIGFKGARGQTNVLFSIGLILAIGFFWLGSSGPWMMSFLGMLMVGFFVFGPQMLIGIACAELSHKKAAATATGFAGFFAYLGASFAGAPLARVAEVWGWGAFFGTVGTCGMIVTLLLLPLWGVTDKKERVKEIEAEAA